MVVSCGADTCSCGQSHSLNLCTNGRRAAACRGGGQGGDGQILSGVLQVRGSGCCLETAPSQQNLLRRTFTSISRNRLQLQCRSAGGERDEEGSQQPRSSNLFPCQLRAPLLEFDVIHLCLRRSSTASFSCLHPLHLLLFLFLLRAAAGADA